MAHQARSNGLRAARLSALRHAIAKNATRHDITIENFAKMLGLSPRYLQHLLYSEGTTLTDELTAQRLNHANRLLQDAASREKSIAEIAQQSGFAELSTFYHAFRRMFGMTPGQLRMDGRDRSAE